MGKKYIIEIEYGKEGIILCQKGIVTVGLHLENESELKPLGIQSAIPYTEPDLERVREEAYELGRKDVETQFCSYDACKNRQEEYQRGLSDAWEAARKIIHMPEGDLLNLFDVYSSVCTPVQVMLKYDASEAIEKIRQYEQRQEEQIQVGDEVISEDDIKAVVIDMDNYLLHVLDQNGVIQGWPREDVVKTDRHFPDIATVLKKMKEV